MSKKNKSILQEEEEDIKIPDYDEEEKNYIRNLQKRLEYARNRREEPREEFDNISYSEYYDANEEGANTRIKVKKNRSDTIFQSGTLRQKMMALLATLTGLNLKPDILAFNKNDFPIASLGNAMEDIIFKTEEMENDEEKKLLRQYELLTQGTVFVEDVWCEENDIEKRLKGKFDGKRKGVEWTEREKEGLAGPKRTVLPGKAVFLGSMDKYFIEDQPYIFSVQVKDYEEAERTYGDWEMWKYVSKNRKYFSTGTMLENTWNLLGNEKGKVEIIKYEDKPNNEFQIIMNGVIMLPPGFPLTEVSPDGYTITQQNLKPIKPNFAIGKSFIFENKNLVAVLDQMMKLAVLKTQKSFMPPYLNLSGRVISKDVFMPGTISRLGRGDLAPLSEDQAQGMTNGEYNMIQEVIKFIDKNTVSQTFAGSQEQGGRVTATQIMELQRQSRIMLGVLILSASLMEKKLATKRLNTLLANWFNPIDSVLHYGTLKSRYRIVSRIEDLDNEGMGLRMIIPTDKPPSKKEVKAAEERLSVQQGMPIKIIVLNAKNIKKSKFVWYITVDAKEKKTSEYNKMMFDEMLARGMNLGLPFDPTYLQSRFATMWEENPQKMFQQGASSGQLAAPPQGQEQPRQQAKNTNPNASETTPSGQGAIMQRAQKGI